jgi:AcrR family transcriptional regulator
VLSVDVIVGTALGLAAESDVDLVTLRQVAAELGTGQSSLYVWVPNRSALLRLMLSRALSEVKLPKPDAANWRRHVVSLATKVHTTLNRYPGLARVMLDVVPVDSANLRLANCYLTLMRLGGVPGRAAAYAVDTLDLYAASSSSEKLAPSEAPYALDRKDEPAALMYFSAVDPDEFPEVRRLAKKLAGGSLRARFLFGLETIVAGLASTTPCGNPHLTPLPHGHAAFLERGGALASVLGLDGGPEMDVLVGPHVLERPVLLLDEDALGGGDGQRSAGHDVAGEVDGGVERGARLDDAVDDAEGVQALGLDGIAGQRQLHHHVVGHAARQAQQRTGSRDESASYLGQRETRGARGDDEVAGDGHLEPAGHGVSLDGGDERLLRRLAGHAREASVGIAGLHPPTERPQVHAGGEPAARPGQDGHRQPVVGVEPLQRRADGFGGHSVDRVADLRPVDREHEDTLAFLDADRLTVRRAHR